MTRGGHVGEASLGIALDPLRRHWSAPRGPKRATRWPQEGPKSEQKWGISRSRFRCPTRGPLWGSLRALMAPPEAARRGPRGLRESPERAPREPLEPTEVEHLKSSVQMLHSGSILVPSKGPHGPPMAALEAPRSPRESPKKTPREPQDATGADRKLTETALLTTALFLSSTLWRPSRSRAWALL